MAHLMGNYLKYSRGMVRHEGVMAFCAHEWNVFRLFRPQLTRFYLTKLNFQQLDRPTFLVLPEHELNPCH